MNVLGYPLCQYCPQNRRVICVSTPDLLSHIDTHHPGRERRLALFFYDVSPRSDESECSAAAEPVSSIVIEPAPVAVPVPEPAAAAALSRLESASPSLSLSSNIERDFPPPPVLNLAEQEAAMRANYATSEFDSSSSSSLSEEFISEGTVLMPRPAAEKTGRLPDIRPVPLGDDRTSYLNRLAPTRCSEQFMSYMSSFLLPGEKTDDEKRFYQERRDYLNGNQAAAMLWRRMRLILFESYSDAAREYGTIFCTCRATPLLTLGAIISFSTCDNCGDSGNGVFVVNCACKKLFDNPLVGFDARLFVCCKSCARLSHRKCAGKVTEEHFQCARCQNDQTFYDNAFGAIRPALEAKSLDVTNLCPFCLDVDSTANGKAHFCKVRPPQRSVALDMYINSNLPQ